ncbi:MAG: hypothetical protein ACO1RT_00595 [Planctomycetaceae bacterium]
MRFSAQTLLVFFALLAIALSVAAVVEVATRGTRRRLRAESELKAMGAYYVGFDENNEPDWVSFVEPIASPGIAKYKSIDTVDLTGADATYASLRHIAELKRLQFLDLTESDITDDQLRLLTTFASLEIVRLNRSKVTNTGIPTIAAINGLNSVDLSGTLVTADGVEKLKKCCPGVTVRYEPYPDDEPTHSTEPAVRPYFSG